MMDRLLGGAGRGPGAHLFLVRLTLAYVLVLLGSFPILAGLGLLRLESPIEPLAIPLAILFGLVFVVLGVAVVGGPLLELARAHGAASGREALALAWRRIRERANRASAVGAADMALLAVACALALAGVEIPLVGSEDTWAEVVSLEFITIHAFPFLLVAVTFWKATTGSGRTVVAFLTLPLVVGYAVLAWVFGGGAAGLFWLAYLLVPNLTPFLAGRGLGDARLLAVSRWCVKISLFMLTAGVVGGGDLSGPGVVALGAVYFALVAGVDLFRVPEIPADLAAEWRRVEGAAG